MKAVILPEPELEFGAGRHVDTRFGLLNYGPLDYERPVAPRRIRVGIVGTNETVEGVARWIERCRGAIPPKTSRQPHLFPGFPGAAPDVGLHTELVLDPRAQRTIAARRFEALKRHRDAASVVSEAADLFLEELRYLADEAQVDVVLCAIPLEQLEAVEEREHPSTTAAAVVVGEHGADSADEEDRPGPTRLDFHDLLKARALPLGRPIQLILPATYDPSKRRRQKRHAERSRQTQDEATRAWNLHTALYYKAGGTPWRIARDPAAYTACYVGVSFYRALDGAALHTSVAQVFDERGDGIVVRGGTAHIAKDDRQPHLNRSADENHMVVGYALRRGGTASGRRGHGRHWGGPRALGHCQVRPFGRRWRSESGERSAHRRPDPAFISASDGRNWLGVGRFRSVKI